MEHTCHARNCNVPVPPRMFMCRRHWFMLPETMRTTLLNLYVPGQERRKDPTRQYLEHAITCVNYVADKEASGAH